MAFSLGLMLLGAVMVWLAPGWGMIQAGRLVAGSGGVIVNIVITKMLVDWFAGKQVSTALAISVNPWPIGIALSLLVLPPIAGSAGLPAAMVCVGAVVAAGLVLFGLGYRPPLGAAPGSARVKMASLPILVLGCAGVIWAFYNVALAIVFSFGPDVLISRGWEVASAGALVSAFMIVLSIFLPFGGMSRIYTGRRDTVILVSLLSFFALLILAFPLPVRTVWTIVLVVAALYGWAAGPIMSLPSVVLAPEARSFGMGVFFSIWYVAMMIAPALAGLLADRSGRPDIAIALGAALVGISIGASALFRVLARTAYAAR